MSEPEIGRNSPEITRESQRETDRQTQRDRQRGRYTCGQKHRAYVCERGGGGGRKREADVNNDKPTQGLQYV